jgi:septum formation protein
MRPSRRPARSASGSRSSADPLIALASKSPQRRAILEAIGVRFRVIDVDVDELETGPPEQVARDNAISKALAGAELAGPNEQVIGVDTVVALDGGIWGKPADEAAASATLAALGGRTHDVVSGVAVVGDESPPRTAVEVTRVTFHDLDEAAIDWYLASGEWRGRAGGYAIQGRGGALVRRVEGDYLNVVGLPVGALAGLFGGFAAFLAERA